MQSLRYSITLNEAQLDYLSDEQQDILRMKCLKTFIRMANHHPHADLPVSLVHRLEIDKERFLRQ